MSNNNETVQSCWHKFDHYKSEFESCAVKSDFNWINSLNLNNDFTDIQNRIDQIRASSNNFSSTFLPIFQVDKFHLLTHRLQIAKNILNIRHLYQNFCFLYDKEADRSILDIMMLIQIYSKLISSISQYVKIQVCAKIKEEVDQKIINIGQMIVKTIQKKGYENLTSTELFQLIILSSSVEQFWEFLDLDESQFSTDKYDILPDNIESLFLLFSKIEKLSNVLDQAGLNEYLNSLKIKKTHFTKIIFDNIKKLCANRTEIKDFTLFSNDIFKKLEQLAMIKNKKSIPIEFKNDLDEEISNVAIFVFDTLKITNQSHFPNMTGFTNTNPFLLFLNDLNSKLKLYVNPEKYDKLNTNENFQKIFLLYQNFILFQFTKGFAVIFNLIEEIMLLSAYVQKENQDFIPVFKLIFYKAARFELNSIIYTLLYIKSKYNKKKVIGFLYKDENMASFEKEDHFKNLYKLINPKNDDNIDINNYKDPLQTIVEIKNGGKLLYEKQVQYVNAIYNNSH